MKLRYTIGETYYFMHINYKSTPYSPGFMPGMDELLGFDIIKLKCISHHRVKEQYGEKPNCDGFLFEDESGKEYANQYPVAYYGQFSNNLDFEVHLRCPSDIDEIDQWVADNDTAFKSYEDITRILKFIDDVLNPKTNLQNPYPIKIKDEFENWEERIKEKLLTEFNKKVYVDYMPHHDKNGEVIGTFKNIVLL